MIGIIKDFKTGWWQKFEEIIKIKNIKYKVIEIERSDWIREVKNCNYIIWRTSLLESLLFEAREKLFFMEKILKKEVYPSHDCYWHHNNKNLQTYFFHLFRIKAPKGFVSYSYNDAVAFLRKCDYPIVSKSAGGASSKNVRMLRDYKEAKKELDYLFSKGLKNKVRKKSFSILKIKSVKNDSQDRYVNYQQFIPMNDRDFRVTTIGNEFAFAYYRKNRKNDFRASGSGKNDYYSEHNLEAIKYCLRLSERFDFDSMCYDILFSNDIFYITEMSYAFVDLYLYNCPGYYIWQNNKLRFIRRHTWPQELIVEYLLEKWGIQPDK